MVCKGRGVVFIDMTAGAVSGTGTPVGFVCAGCEATQFVYKCKVNVLGYIWGQGNS